MIWKILEWSPKYYSSLWCVLKLSRRFHSYRPQRSWEGYVFTGVCLSTGGCLVPGGAWSWVVSALGGLVPGRGGAWSGAWYPGMHRGSPPGETATAADGTHPTGMHSCSSSILHTFLGSYLYIYVDLNDM